MITKTKREISQYSEAFKRTVIEEYLRTGASQRSLMRKYEIKMQHAFRTWMKQLGYENIHQKGGTLKKSIPPPLAAKKLHTDEPTSNQALEKRIKELERLLEDEQLRSEAYQRIIDIAEKEYHIPIRKKPNTK